MKIFSEALANIIQQFLNYSIAFVLGKHNLSPTFGVKRFHFDLGEIFYSRILMSAVLASRYRAPYTQVKTEMIFSHKPKHPCRFCTKEWSHCSLWSLWSSSFSLWSFISNQLNSRRSWRTWAWFLSRCLPGSSSGPSGLLIIVKSRQIF